MPHVDGRACERFGAQGGYAGAARVPVASEGWLWPQGSRGRRAADAACCEALRRARTVHLQGGDGRDVGSGGLQGPRRRGLHADLWLVASRVHAAAGAAATQ
eukprot:2791802-Prymnesium_polylepis.1